MGKIIERIKYEYYLTAHEILVGKMKKFHKKGDFRSAYSYVDAAINSGLRAVVACRKMGEETMYLREALNHLKPIRTHFIRGLNQKDLAAVISKHQYMKEIRKKTNSPSKH